MEMRTKSEVGLVGEMEGLALALCRGERIGDETDCGLFWTARGVEAFFTEGEAFSRPRPGGMVGDDEFVLALASGARRFGLTVEVGARGMGGLSETVRGLPDPLVAWGGRELTVSGAVAGFVLNIGGRGNLISLN